MHKTFFSLLITLPLLLACQSATKPEPGQGPAQRWQGELSRDGQDWLLQPCDQQRQIRMQAGKIAQEQYRLFSAAAEDKVFADLSLNNGKIEMFYRLQHEGHGCNDLQFQHTLLRASGNEPFWSLFLARDGLLLTQPGNIPLALPYIEEALPDGSIHLTARQEQENIQAWIKPQTCIDSMSAAMHHMTVMLDWNGHSFSGCAHFGGQRK